MAHKTQGLIVYGVLPCGNIRTADRPDGPKEDPQYTALLSRFWSKVDQKSDAECWPWLRHTVRGGYGSIKIAGKNTLAHRVAWELTHGAIPIDRQINHRCHNAACCNPAHLYLGTQQQNVLDAIDSGRHVNPPRHLRRSVRNQHMTVGRPLHRQERMAC